MERRKASDFPRGLLDLFREYQHGHIDRRTFLNGAGRFAAGALTVGAIFEMMRPNYAWAQQVAMVTQPASARVLDRLRTRFTFQISVDVATVEQGLGVAGAALAGGVTVHCFLGYAGTYRCTGASRSRRPWSCRRAAATAVSGFETAPRRKRVSGVSGVRLSTSDQPKPSAQTISPSTATATERPGRLSSTTSARASRLDSPTEPAYWSVGAADAVDGTAAASS
jgi:hypothetical protein